MYFYLLYTYNIQQNKPLVTKESNLMRCTWQQQKKKKKYETQSHIIGLKKKEEKKKSKKGSIKITNVAYRLGERARLGKVMGCGLRGDTIGDTLRDPPLGK